jgi:hypothetical protein
MTGSVFQFVLHYSRLKLMPAKNMNLQTLKEKNCRHCRCVVVRRYSRVT